VTTAAGGPTPGAAGTPDVLDRKNVTVGGVKRPDPRTPLGQSAAKLPRGEATPPPPVVAAAPAALRKEDDSGDDDFVAPPGPYPRGERSTTIIGWGAAAARATKP